ncbi:hypothetical protein FD18_GL000915 [Lactobacillus taiwanensis DSM 21401]|uniref:hypothetical protein n=1 Tax=Lactobacillus taiwanensis TaxID=508451 RepID=UPI0006F088B6|nr:hypothetical protein [Lactobacillus taiwanensis]KRM97964.1 hypothetical protein FD18_GL000915 [Lactobacillus taiwanensis DSM 21401]
MGKELSKYGNSSKIDEEKYPALNQLIPVEVMERETNEALSKFTDDFIDWLKAYPDFQPVVAVFWKVCASQMAKNLLSVDADLYGKQMRRASKAVLGHDWNSMKIELMNITGWWD